MSLVIPFTFVGGAGNKARASEVNANFAACSAKFTEGAGGISDGDVSSTAAIKGSKLSSTSGNRVTASQLEDGAADKRVLYADATTDSPQAAVNSPNHIKKGIISQSKLNLQSVLLTIPAILASGSLTNVDTTLVSTSAFPILMVRELAGFPSGSDHMYTFALDTVSTKWWIHVTPQVHDIASFTMRVWYLPVP